CASIVIPLRGSIPYNRTGLPLSCYLNVASQSPYGAQSLATAPNPADDDVVHGVVAIPLRGSIPCNPRSLPLPSTPSPTTCRNPLTGLNPLQLRGSSPGPLPSSRL